MLIEYKLLGWMVVYKMRTIRPFRGNKLKWDYVRKNINTHEEFKSSVKSTIFVPRRPFNKKK